MKRDVSNKLEGLRKTEDHLNKRIGYILSNTSDIRLLNKIFNHEPELASQQFEKIIRGGKYLSTVQDMRDDYCRHEIWSEELYQTIEKEHINNGKLREKAQKQK